MDGAEYEHSLGGPRFDDPPIQLVILSIFFKPLFSLGPSALVKILDQWSEEYPGVEEFHPLPFWRPLNDDEGQNYRAGEVAWPAPLVQLDSVDSQRSIRVQQDRLELLWRFEAESDKKYVGYGQLRNEIIQRMDQFSTAVKELVDLEVIPERADVSYKNLIDLPVRDFAVGVLTNWSDVDTALSVSTYYTAMRIGGFEEQTQDSVATMAAFEPGPDGAGTDLGIEAQCTLDEGEGFVHALDRAHEWAIHIFGNVVSDQMRISWGEQ